MTEMDYISQASEEVIEVVLKVPQEVPKQVSFNLDLEPVVEVPKITESQDIEASVTLEEMLQELQEFDGLPSNIPPYEAPTMWQTLVSSCYDRDTGRIFGQTRQEFLQVILAYSFFFIVILLAGASLLGVLGANIKAKQMLKRQLKLQNQHGKPDLLFEPFDSIYGHKIIYNFQDPNSTEKWTGALDEFLNTYHNVENEINTKDCDFSFRVNHKTTVCKVDIDHFGPCSPENNYGYNGTSPCVFLKLGNLHFWEPKLFSQPQPDMPKDLANAITNVPKNKNSQVWVSCEGENPDDLKNMDKIQYYPGNGFPDYFFPCMNALHYRSPLIAIQFENIKPNTVLNIECRIWAKNIENKGGFVRFEISANNESVTN